MKISTEQNFKVRFLPEEKEIEIPGDINILESARLLNIPLIADCGGMGVCGRCKVKLKKGTVRQEENFTLSSQDKKEGYILACQSFPSSDIVVEVPSCSVPRGIKISQRLDIDCPDKEHLLYPYQPLVEKILLQIEPPWGEENLDDFQRLSLALKEKVGVESFVIPYKTLKNLPHILRTKNWQVTVTFSRDLLPARILSIEAGDTTEKNMGIVMDVGTTSIEAMLVDIPSGRIKHFTSHLNPQVKYGTDLNSRLMFAETEQGVMILSDIVMDKINEILLELTLELGVNKDQVNSCVISGNTVMIHFLLGINTQFLRKHPHTPTALKFPLYRAEDLNLYINPQALVYITPGIGGYVGGDMVSSLLCTGMKEDSFLLADMGTNGEIASVFEGTILCASTSAGPAFEGGGVRWGMRAEPGAISRVHFSKTHQDFTFSVLDNRKPQGICGTGLIDLLAHLFKRGFLDRKGKFKNQDKSHRFMKNPEHDHDEFVLFSSTPDRETIAINEREIAYILATKGAFFTGYNFLLKKMEKTFKDVNKFYIAGALGEHINAENGITLGLFPDINKDRFSFIGNGSLKGGRFLLLSRQARQKAGEIAENSLCLDLSREAEYMNDYTSSLFIPHTDLSLFPSVGL